MVDVNKDSQAAIPPDLDFQMRRREPEQPSLFPTTDLIVPETLRNIKKSVSAIHTSPTNAEHSLNTRRLFDACILVAQIDCRGREKQLVERIRTDRISPMFEVRVTEIARLANIPGKNYVRLYKDLDKLYDMSLRWNLIGDDAQVEWEMKSHLLSALGYGQEHKRGLIRFAFDPAILEIVLEPSRWATLSLNVMANLKTAASYALYQNAWRYIGTHAKVTAALPTETWIELLIGKSRYVVDDGEGGKRVENYGDFKRRVLIDAIERVNSAQALSHELELKELKSGNRVAKLQFRFKQKTQHSLGLPLTWTDDILKVLENLGFDQSEIKNLSEAHSYEEVAETILRLKTAENRLATTGKTITSKKAYFEGILRNIASGSSGSDLDHEKIAEEVRQQELLKAAEVRKERLKTAFENHQRECFSAWLFSLPTTERQELVGEFKSSPSATPPVRGFFDKELTANNVSALALLRIWIGKAHPEKMEQVFPNTEDKAFDDWMAWRIEQDGNVVSY